MITQILHVNFSSLTVPHLISVVQGDTGRNLKCIVDDFTLDGAWTATWYVERPSDVPVYNTATIETSDNSVNIELTAQSINEVGDNKLQVRILDTDDQVVTSFACILSVKPFGGIDAVESTTESNIFDQQVEEAFDEIDTHKADALEEIDTEIDTHVADGKFPNMAAGDIISDLYAENKVPYFFRQSGGGAEVGTIEAPVLVGGSVGWNQLELFNRASETKSGVACSIANGITTLNGTATANSFFAPSNTSSAPSAIVGHKYLAFSNIQNASTSRVCLALYGNTGLIYIPGTASFIWSNANSTSTIQIGYRYASGATFNNEKIQGGLVDLTLLLGSTIADRLYTLEQSTAGSGIAQLRACGFDFDEYVPYTAPTLKHVEGVSAHVMRDASDNIIGNYALDSTLTLRGVPKLDANNQLYYDGDTYEPDGTVTRRYGVVDLGTLNWNYDSTNQRFSTGLPSTAPMKLASQRTLPLVCQKYVAITNGGAFDINWNNVIYNNNNINGIVVHDHAYSDATTFKTAMSGVYLVYELATATTETATPFAEYQEVDANGTEEYVSIGVVPVGHVTKYPTDLKGAVESILSAIPSANGTYALKVTVNNGKKTFSWV